MRLAAVLQAGSTRHVVALVRPLLDLEVFGRFGQLHHQRADLFGGESDLVRDELRLEVHLAVFGSFAQVFGQAGFLARRFVSGGLGGSAHCDFASLHPIPGRML